MLRANACKYRESSDKTKNSNFFLSAPKNPFGELFSKMILKGPVSFNFFQKKIKLKIRQTRPPGRPFWMKFSAFLKRSCRQTKKHLDMPFAQLFRYLLRFILN